MSQCRALKKKKKNQNQYDESTNITFEEIADALICFVDSPIESWILDSCLLFHSTPR